MPKKVGRPTVITKEVVSLLVASFHSGLTVREACWQSGISHEAYYSRLREDSKFADTMAKAQSDILINSKTLIANSIKEGNLGSAKWWIEHQNKSDPKEESPKPEEPLTEEEVKELETSLLSLLRIKEIRENREISGTTG